MELNFGLVHFYLHLQARCLWMFGRFFHEWIEEDRLDAKAAGMGKEVMQRDLTCIGVTKGLDMAMGRVIKPQLALLHQNRDAGGHNWLGVGCHPEHGVSPEADALLLVLPAQRLVHNHPAFARN